MMLNDAIFLLDESLSKLSKIHHHQVLVQSPEWVVIPLAQRQDLEAEIQQIERIV